MAVTLTAGLMAGSPAEAVPRAVPAATSAAHPPVSILTGDGAHDRDARRLEVELIRNIDASPKGAKVGITTYRIDLADVVDALIQAHRRGVIVQVVEDAWAPHTSPSYVQTQRLKAALGTKVSASGSYIALPRKNGFTSVGGSVHAKFYTFERLVFAGRVYRYRVMAGSANPTGTNTMGSWNETLVKDDATLYAGLIRYSAALAADRNSPGWTSYVRSGSTSLGMGPEYPNMILRDLRTIHAADCRKGVTLRGSVYLFTDGRLTTAKRLRELGAAGCKVQLDLNTTASRPLVGAGVWRLLFGAKNVTIRNSHALGRWYTHGKTLQIVQRGKTRTYSGSDNWTGGHSSELLVKSSDAATNRAFTVWLGRIWAASRPATRGDLSKNVPTVKTSAADRRRVEAEDLPED